MPWRMRARHPHHHDQPNCFRGLCQNHANLRLRLRGGDHQFEAFQSITAEAERKCPECGKQKLRRLIGPGAAIVFKGSGFYKTDYRSESYKKGAAADTGNHDKTDKGKK